ncbi:terminal hydrolase calypso [Seminavis robusta]|uniref:Ubiquitin carboxyl-terminal hydrolase n=1 Tax=Seminavis robusta TaxID=568900 RepID=A0A9N8DTM9_9STRA|nr:terminal hydrolase calypso [Seminavis robusta]|eukprot:Sro271_g104400.1 terminal hydrolase calypso (331) ;mRNA; f:4332-5517
MAEGGEEWCTIESDPGVFSEVLEEVGCKHVELEELWSLDEETLMTLHSTGAVYGLIFLFKWESKKNKPPASPSAKPREPLSEDVIPPNLFFAHQTMTNACATQAILSVVMNAGLTPEQLGPTLAEFHSFTMTFPPSLKGDAIASSDEIRKAHNSFKKQDAFLQEGRFHIPTGDEEAFHFVSYIPLDGTVYELDGLQKGPIPVGTFSAGEPTSWLAVAREAIQERMNASPEIKFNLMAVIQDQRLELKRKLGELENDNDKAAEHSEVVASLAAQDAKREQWKRENQQRRHNYVPLCMEIIKGLAKLGTLPELATEAKERYAEKIAKKKMKT